MAEISREDAIKSLNGMIFASGIAREHKPAPLNMTFEEVKDTLKKAISDMEKLEKIEKIIDDCTAYPDDMCECLIEIEQIVKGE